MANTRTHKSEYCAWVNIRHRCTNPKHAAYPKYGGRGITVCKTWLDSFDNFFADMGPKPNAKMSIDRIDNNGNYEPSNCRWATRLQQQLNRSVTRLITINGKTQSLSEWAKETGLNTTTLHSRLKVGITGGAIIQPPQNFKK